MRQRTVMGVLALAAVIACQEKLVTPTECPELCPGTSAVIRDTVLTAKLGFDSTYTGYVRADQVGALLVSSGLEAGEARAYMVFPARPDSATVDGIVVAYTIDSIGIGLNLIGRDSTVKDLRLVVHRIAPTVDTTTSFDDLEAQLTPESLVDSLQVADTLKSGHVTVIVKGAALDQLLPSVPDGGLLGLALRVSAAVPTGVRFSPQTGGNGPIYTTYVHADVSDTAKQRQTFALASTSSNYVIEAPPPPAEDQLFLGGRSGSRLLLRFVLPKAIKDSGALIRATLELTPAEALKGLPNDPGELQLRAALIDLGAKSPALSGVGATGHLETGATAVQEIDMRTVASSWLGPNGLPPTILLGLAPEGGTFSRPVFLSTLSSAGAPRLRITYALSSHPGNP